MRQDIALVVDAEFLGERVGRVPEPNREAASLVERAERNAKPLSFLPVDLERRVGSSRGAPEVEPVSVELDTLTCGQEIVDTERALHRREVVRLRRRIDGGPHPVPDAQPFGRREDTLGDDADIAAPLGKPASPHRQLLGKPAFYRQELPVRAVPLHSTEPHGPPTMPLVFDELLIRSGLVERDRWIATRRGGRRARVAPRDHHAIVDR